MYCDVLRVASRIAGLVLIGTGFAAGTASGDPVAIAHGRDTGAILAITVQASGGSQALLDYFTFIPQALILLFAVGVRRYVLDGEDIPWWLDDDSLRAPTDQFVSKLRRGPGTGESASSDSTSRTTTSRNRSDSVDGADGAESGSASTGTTSTATTGGNTQSQSGSSSATSSGKSTNRSDSTASEKRTRRSSGPVADRLALGYENQKVVVDDGDTVDEAIRSMVRRAGKEEYTKWIDDRHLHFIHDEHGFTMVVYGENLTRLNGERLATGDRARVYPGDEIELSGVVTLSVARA